MRVVKRLILMMTAVANGLKLLTEVGAVHRHRRMFGGIVAVILVTLPASIGLILYLGYEHGAINLSSFYFNNVSQYPFRFLQTNVDTPFAANWLGWAHTAAGAMVMAALMAVQHHYLWWPFHPLGYPVSCVFGGMWFSVFIALVLKTTTHDVGALTGAQTAHKLLVGVEEAVVCRQDHNGSIRQAFDQPVSAVHHIRSSAPSPNQ